MIKKELTERYHASRVDTLPPTVSRVLCCGDNLDQDLVGAGFGNSDLTQSNRAVLLNNDGFLHGRGHFARLGCSIQRVEVVLLQKLQVDSTNRHLDRTSAVLQNTRLPRQVMRSMRQYCRILPRLARRTQPSQTSRSFLSFPSLLPQLFGVGTTVRVVLYLLHILSAALDRPAVCLASRVAPHHSNRQP